MKQIITILTILLTVNSFSQTLAFPCAYGAGAYATGGRGGQVIHVTTLNWTGPGSLREAITTQGPRTIVFDVSGEIDATQESNWSPIIDGRGANDYDNITIAGQTALAGGITIKTSFFSFESINNFIIRYVRFRRSSTTGFNASTIWLRGCNNFILDHCNVSHGADESFDLSSSDSQSGDGTIQNCFFQDGEKGMILGTDTGNEPVSSSDLGDFTLVDNLFSNISHRFPNPQGNGQYDIINNVVYNWKNRLIRITNEGTYNVINNYYKPSANGLRLPGWFGNGTITFLHKLQAHTYDSPLIYTSGSIVTGQRDVAQVDDRDMWEYFYGSTAPYGDGAGGVTPGPIDVSFTTSTQFPLSGASFTIKTANQAYTDVLNNAGANKTLNADGSINSYRDTKDVADVLMIHNDSYSGSFYDPVNTIPYPVNPTNTRSGSFYVSNAHIPEVWFLANVPTGEDHNDIAPSGYTWLEEYLNEVDAVCTGSVINSCSGKNAPVAAISTPLAASYNKADTLDFGISYTSDTTVVSVDYYLNNTLLANTTTPFTLDTVGLSQGTYTSYAVLTDACGKTSNTDTISITITPLEVVACKTLTSPIIDGIEDYMWTQLPWQEMSVTEIGLPYPDTNSLKASYKIAWDATSLYFFVRIKDDILISDSPLLEFFRDDAVSIYIDGLDDNSVTYDANDNYFGFRQGSTDINVNGSIYTGSGVTKTDVVTTNGYDMEVKIDWSYLGITPTVGNDIGLDFRVDDDDNGGSRENHVLWNDETSTLWNNPSKFGVLKLTNTACYNTTNIKVQEQEGLTIYPNPTKGELTITSENTISKIEVYNSLGALVLSKDKLSSKTQELNLVKLSKGVYSIKIYEVNRTIEKQIIKQ